MVQSSSVASPSPSPHSLSGHTHIVYTGVTLVYRDATGTQQERCFHEATEVTVATLTDDIIESYVQSEEPL